MTTNDRRVAFDNRRHVSRADTLIGLQSQLVTYELFGLLWCVTDRIGRGDGRS
ncbi:MAG TPA: hypothetical protein VFF86_08695 [Candidatus Methylomirabilis sp.]|nr:hypothetical protein [Candidatus Methylomirabilis sp.]